MIMEVPIITRDPVLPAPTAIRANLIPGKSENSCLARVFLEISTFTDKQSSDKARFVTIPFTFPK
jgi:hypothetical protein